MSKPVPKTQTILVHRAVEIHGKTNSFVLRAIVLILRELESALNVQTSPKCFKSYTHIVFVCVCVAV